MTVLLNPYRFGGGALLYDAMLAESPLAIWNFDEASGMFQDSSGGSDHTSAVGSTTTYRNWTGPDGVARATANLGLSNGWRIVSPSSDLLSFPLTFVYSFGSGAKTSAGGLFGVRGSSQHYFRCYYDGTTYFYILIARDTGATYRYWRYSLTSTEWDAVRLISVAMTDNDTAPVLKMNGSTKTVASTFGPSGTVNTGTNVWIFGHQSTTAVVDAPGPAAIYSGVAVDLASIESAATTEGWY